MKEKSSKNVYLKAGLIFFIMFVVMNVTAFLKYHTFGSFNGELNNRNLYIACGSNGVSILLMLVALFTYFLYSRQKLFEKTNYLASICTAITFAYVVNVGISALSMHYMPMAIAAFILVLIADRRDIFIANLFNNILVAITLLFESIMGNKVDPLNVVITLIIGLFIGSLVAYTMSDIVRRFSYAVRGILIAGVKVLLLFVASLIGNSFDFVHSLGYICITAFAQPLLGLILQPIFESIFNIITNTKLNELTDHNSPLMKILINDALGTFNHSLSVASFAEVCALRIGENPYLAKACAYYHDVGKIKNPTFFSENQSGYNPHDELLPEVSAKILRAHTTDGYELCQKYRIPKEITDVTLQHHGTLPMAVFYAKAKKLTDDEVDIYEYSYHGQPPVTKIAAIIMLCDACEAALRSRSKPTSAEVDQLVSSIINDRIARHQFDNCDITMRDLNTIKQTIIGLYGGVFHERVKYPSGKKD